MDFIPWYILLVRLVAPITILHSPLWGTIFNMFADMSDWDFISVIKRQDNFVYQSWDKAMDFYGTLFVMWVVYYWKDLWARRVAISLFIYRTLGMIGFLITGWRPILFFFPNVFENFVLTCLLIYWITKKTKLNLNIFQKYLMLEILILPKLIHEYFQHYLLYQPWEIYSLGEMLQLSQPISHTLDLLVWGSLLYVIPISCFVWIVARSNRK